MISIFECSEQIINNKILTTARFYDGYAGVLMIAQFETLELGEKKEERLNFILQGGRELRCAQESENYPEQYRRKEPFSRSSQYTYLPYGFNDFDILTTSNDSRFLILKKAMSVGTSSSAVDDCPDEEIGIILDDMEELSTHLDDILIRIGVPSNDISSIKENILGRFP